LFTRVAALAAILAAFAFAAPPAADAMPIFAQRYLLRCDACHTVLPELNAFGDAFRARGYRLPLPIHGTTVVALRYQLEYEKDPTPGAQRFTPGAVVLSDVQLGKIDAFLHYNLGAQGGPSGAYLAFLAAANQHTNSVWRAGLYELPLVHSPGQRLDDLQTYGYEGTHVGLNDLTLTQPRLGVEMDRHAGVATVAATFAYGEFKGAAYGGKPIATGVSTGPAAPELGAFFRIPVAPWLRLSLDAMEGSRTIAPTGRSAFDDAYRRDALGADLHAGPFSVLLQQWWGSDSNADGFGTRIDSSGGFARFRYMVTPHAYVGFRYDAAAAPDATRDSVVYAAWQVFGRARLLVQNVHTFNGTSSLGGALTVALPGPLHPR
jgi:hypothetical protein